jgi:hypothetical protein
MQTAVLVVDECFKSFRFKKQANTWSGVRRHAAALKHEHVRVLQKLFWFDCQFEANCVTFPCETQTAKLEH